MWFSSVPKEDFQRYLSINARLEQAYWLATDLREQADSDFLNSKKTQSTRDDQEKEINLLLENEEQIAKLGDITQPIARLTQDEVNRYVYLSVLTADQALLDKAVMRREDSYLVSFEGMLDAEVEYLDQYLELIGMDIPEAIDAKGIKEFEQGIGKLHFFNGEEDISLVVKEAITNFRRSYKRYQRHQDCIEAYVTELSSKLDFKDDLSKKTFKEQIKNHWKKILSCGSGLALAGHNYTNSLFLVRTRSGEYESGFGGKFIYTSEKLLKERQQHLLALQRLIINSSIGVKDIKMELGVK